MGTLLGAIVPVAARLLESNTASEIIRRMGGPGAIEDSLLTAEMGIVALGITCFAISVATHAAEDERSGRAEQVRATAVGRTAVWVASGIVAFAGSAWLALLAGVAAGIGAGRSSHRSCRSVARAGAGDVGHHGDHAFRSGLR